MCSSNNMASETIARINGRPVLQPKSNQIHALERRNSFKKPPPRNTPARNTNSIKAPSLSTNVRSVRPSAASRVGKAYEMPDTPPSNPNIIKMVRRSKNFSGPVKISSSQEFQKPGTIAAARKEEVAKMHERRKSKIAHYGRTESYKIRWQCKKDLFNNSQETLNEVEKRRCGFITPYSDPILVSYHDEEWGVPVHDDKLLFELLVLTSAQVGSDWTTVLKKRRDFREAYSGFDPQVVAEYSDKEIQSLSSDYGLELNQVRASVDNAKQILEVKKLFASFGNYLWRFVNHKPVSTEYRTSRKIPNKTSKSEAISKDMVRRGFRYVGPTVIHSFMQASGLTNDHVVTCPRYLRCSSVSASHPHTR